MNIALTNDRFLRLLLQAVREAAMRGDRRASERLLQEADLAAPRHPLLEGERAMRWLADGDTGRARTALKQLSLAHPEYPNLTFGFALACALQGCIEEAVAALDRVVDAPPDIGLPPAEHDAAGKRAAAERLRSRLLNLSR